MQDKTTPLLGTCFDIVFPAHGVGKYYDLLAYLKQSCDADLVIRLEKQIDQEFGLSSQVELDFICHKIHFRLFELVAEAKPTILETYARHLASRPVFASLLDQSWYSSLDLIQDIVPKLFFAPPLMRFLYPSVWQGFVRVGWIIENFSPSLEAFAYGRFLFHFLRHLCYRLSLDKAALSDSSYKFWNRNGLINGSFSFPILNSICANQKPDSLFRELILHRRVIFPPFYLSKTYSRLFIFGLATTEIAPDQYEMLRMILKSPNFEGRFTLNTIKKLYWGNQNLQDVLASVNIISEASKKKLAIRIYLPKWEQLPSI